jgi:hypothetical protein
MQLVYTIADRTNIATLSVLQRRLIRKEENIYYIINIKQKIEVTPLPCK